MNMTLEASVSILGFILTLGTVIAGAVWVMAKISGTTMLLTEQMVNLSRSTDRLTMSLDKLQETASDHEVRLRLLEAVSSPKENDLERENARGSRDKAGH